jgi:hypothetical protein
MARSLARVSREVIDAHEKFAVNVTLWLKNNQRNTQRVFHRPITNVNGHFSRAYPQELWIRCTRRDSSMVNVGVIDASMRTARAAFLISLRRYAIRALACAGFIQSPRT